MTREILARLRASLTPTNQRPAALTPAHRIEASAGTAQVWIYDEIGGWGIWAADLVPELAALDVDQIEVHLNSPGGDYFDGVAIGNALAEHKAKVTVHVDGMAASAASVIAMAGDEIVMHPGAQMMIHDALTMTIGNAAEHERTRSLLDSASADIASLYASRAGGEPDVWRTAMRAETWYRGDEAVTAGLADRTITRDPGEAPTGPAWAALLSQWRSNDSAPVAVAVQPAAEASALPVFDAEAFRSAIRKANA